MRAGLFVVLFVSAVCVRAAPPPEAKRDLIDNLTKAAEELFSSDIEPILHSATPAIESLFKEATAEVGSFLATNTALGHEATSLLGAAEAKVTGIEKDLANHNGAQGTAWRESGFGAATLLGSVLLGAYATL